MDMVELLGSDDESVEDEDESLDRETDQGKQVAMNHTAYTEMYIIIIKFSVCDNNHGRRHNRYHNLRITKTLFQMKISWYKKIPLADEAKLVSMTHITRVLITDTFAN